MKQSIRTLLTVSAFSLLLPLLASAQAPSKTPPKAAPGTFACNSNYDIRVIQAELNSICDTKKSPQFTAATGKEGALAFSYCCIAK